MKRKMPAKKAVFSWLFVLILLTITIVYASRYGAYVVVPEKTLAISDIRLNLGEFELLGDAPYPPGNLGVSAVNSESESYPENLGNIISSHLKDSEGRDFYVYVIDMGDKTSAREVWKNIWGRESNMVAKSTAKITRSSYYYGRAERLGGYYEIIVWQKDKWVVQ